VHDWGIGEIGDLNALCRWLSSAGHRLLQLLPIFEIAPGERSPYAALSAFAIDPIYLSLGAVEDFTAAGGEAALDAEARAALAGLRTAPGIDYDAVRALKRRALEIAFERFVAHESTSGSARADAFARFCAAEAGWLDDYTLFRACQEHYRGTPWSTWPSPAREREPDALVTLRATLARTCRFHAYVQWLAAAQWTQARAAATAAGVQLKGDFPFAVAAESADVWARQHEFRLDASLGAPPDAFNAAGQEWGLPVYRWDVMARTGFAWLAARVRRSAALYDAFRIDHVVGLYRMYVVETDGRAFVPATEDEQLALGERLLRVILAAAAPAAVIAEDLGVVPPFVRRSLAQLGIPGYRVLRWESDDPATYPACSVATTGTHDTSSLAVWWEEELGAAGREALTALPSFTALRALGAAFTPAVHAALLDGLYGAGSALVVLPFADAYGGRERINVPATVAESNWSYRLPWTFAALDGAAGSRLRARLHELAARQDRA
jgi:4-alpha-glucanotransferase